MYNFTDIIEIYKAKLKYPFLNMDNLNFFYKMQKQYPEYSILDILEAFIIFDKYEESVISMEKILELLNIKKIHID